jgi:uncharacterized tellurite resistance protein B-like protein
MLRTFKALFENRVTNYSTTEDDVDPLSLAVAALLFEISKADHEVGDDERQVMGAAIKNVCGVSAEDIDQLLEDADGAVEKAVSLYDFTSVINEHLNREKKYEILLLLWRVAYADGRLDRYEEYFIRKITDLLHLSHQDFIRAKHAAST